MANSNKIDRFLNQEMSPEENKLFLKEIENNPELAKEVSTQKLEKEAIDLLFEEEFKEKIAIWREEAKQLDNPQPNTGPVPQTTRFINRWAAAAIILLLIGSGLYLWASSNYSNSSILANNFYNPNQDLDQLVINSRGNAPSPDKTTIQEFEIAKNELLKENYQNAIDRLSIMSLSNPEVQYLLALAYYENKDFAKAIPLLQDLSVKDGPFEYQAKIYLMYSYLANDQTEDPLFQSLLEQIINEDFYPKAAKDKAKRIQNDLGGSGRKVYRFFH